MPSQRNRIKSNKIKYSQLKPRNMECIQTLGCFCLLVCFDVITQDSVWFNFGELTHWFRRTDIPAKPGGHPFCGAYNPIFFWSLHIAQCPACLNLLAYCLYEIISDGINSCSIFNIQIGTKWSWYWSLSKWSKSRVPSFALFSTWCDQLIQRTGVDKIFAQLSQYTFQNWGWTIYTVHRYKD